jgi:hypothetical protein
VSALCADPNPTWVRHVVFESDWEGIEFRMTKENKNVMQE